jgi:phage terminase large subunit-like protein
MKTAKAVLDGLKTDERTFALMFQIDEGDDWKDPATWIKSNPGLGESISYEYLTHQCKQAQNAGGRAVVEFMTKHLNIFVSSSSQWVDRDNWRANITKDEPEPGAVCYAGLDLGSVSDMTALALLFPRENDFLIKVHFFVPERAIERKLEEDESTIYAKLADLDNVHVTPGNVTDYDYVRKMITGHHTNDEGRVIVDPDCLATKYELKSVAFDRYNSSQLIIDITNDGVECAPFGMGFVSQSAPTKEAERLILDGKLKHDGDPVLEWQLGAVALTYDPAGNVKITKSKSGKVDGLVALVMALGEFMTWNDEETAPTLPDDFTIRTL